MEVRDTSPGYAPQVDMPVASEGYKQSEVGIIPEEWVVESLGNHAAFRTGPFGSALHKSDYVNDGVPVVNPMHIVQGTIQPSSGMKITESTAERLSEFRLQPGEIVIGRRGDMGRCAVVRNHQSGWLCGTGSMIVRPKDADPEFLQRMLSSRRVIEAIENTSVGTTMVNLNQGTMSGLKIQFPPIQEQRAIATTLSDVDALLEALDRLIAKKRDIKQATMQQLLTAQTRLPGFEGEWETIRFCEMALPSNVRIDPSRSVTSEFCVELEHIEQRTGRLIGCTSTSSQSSLKAVFELGDVLFGKLRAYLRKYWLADRKGVCSTEIWVLKPNPQKVVPGYLYQLVRTDWFIEAASTAYGTHMPRSDWKVVRELELSVPKLSEQETISRTLGDMDAELEALQQRRAKTATLKQAMMQELLTGRTRLVNLRSVAEASP